jgi:hypothetical protein
MCRPSKAVLRREWAGGTHIGSQEVRSLAAYVVLLGVLRRDDHPLQVDTSRNGEIEYAEFKALLQGKL